jgi:hypothetical protein
MRVIWAMARSGPRERRHMERMTMFCVEEFENRVNRSKYAFYIFYSRRRMKVDS